MLKLIKYLLLKYIVERPKYNLLPKLDINLRPSPNFNLEKHRPIKFIVLHNTMSDSIESTLHWFEDRLSGVSAHYVIGKDGKIYQCVALKNVAWHAGQSRYKDYDAINRYSFGIELVSSKTDGSDTTQIQRDTALTICWILANMYGLDGDSIINHKMVSYPRKTDEGIPDLEEFKRSLDFYQKHKEVFEE